MAIANIFDQLDMSAAHEPNGGQMNQLYLDIAPGKKKKSNLDLVGWLSAQHANHPVQVWSHFLLALG
jgi:hypothetical protein